MEFPARYAPLCKAQSFPKWKVRGTQHLRTAQMAGNEPFGKMDSVLRNNFLGKGFAKPRLIFLRDFGFRPRGGGVWGGIRAGFLSDFGEAGN